VQTSVDSVTDYSEFHKMLVRSLLIERQVTRKEKQVWQSLKPQRCAGSDR